jgi:hypothetical protein
VLDRFNVKTGPTTIVEVGRARDLLETPAAAAPYIGRDALAVVVPEEDLGVAKLCQSGTRYEAAGWVSASSASVSARAERLLGDDAENTAAPGETRALRNA